MARYGFTSPGAAAGNAIQEFLMQRALMERQQRMDQLLQDRQASAMEVDQRNVGLREEEAMARRAQMEREEAQAQSERERAASTAANQDGVRQMIADRMTQGPLDQQTAQQIGVMGWREGVGVPGIVEQAAKPAPPPESFTLGEGDTRYDTTGKVIARGAPRRPTTGTDDLSRQLKEIQVETASDKLTADRQKRTDAEATNARARTAAVNTAKDTVDVLKQLADFNEDGTVTLKPGAANLFGARIPGASFVPGSETANASGALNRLRSRTIIDLLNEMKSQSRTGATGFGAMNEKEFGVLEGGASQLGSSFISDETAAGELKRIYDVAQRALQGDQPPAVPSAGGSSFRVVGVK